MLIWFATIALLGMGGIVKHPAVFVALNPAYGLSYLFSNGATRLSGAGRSVSLRHRGGSALC